MGKPDKNSLLFLFFPCFSFRGWRSEAQGVWSLLAMSKHASSWLSSSQQKCPVASQRKHISQGTCSSDTHLPYLYNTNFPKTELPLHLNPFLVSNASPLLKKQQNNHPIPPTPPPLQSSQFRSFWKLQASTKPTGSMKMGCTKMAR